MDSAKLNDWMQVLGMFAIVASLIFVGLQMKQSRDIALGEGAVANAANRIEVNNALSAHAEVWIRGRAGGELDEAEQVIFRNLVQNENNQRFFNWHRVRILGYDDAAGAIVMNMARFLVDNPGARQVWIDYETGNESDHKLAPNRDISFDWFDDVQTGIDRLEGDPD
jgi:hypothetical protein